MKWVFLILLAVMLTGCGSSTTSVDNQILSGTEGLRVTFLRQSMPSDILEEEQALIPVEIENLGAYDLIDGGDGVITLSLEEDLLEFQDWHAPDGFLTRGESLIFSMRGRSLARPVGERQVVQALVRARPIEYTRNMIETRVGISVCYPYRSTLSSQICIDTDPQSLSPLEKSCEAKTVTSSGQGAPVVIDSVEQRILPSNDPQDVRVQLIIHAKNAGNGIVLNEESYDDVCVGGAPSNTQFDTIFVHHVSFSDYAYDINRGGEIECSPQPMQTLEDGYMTRCTLDASFGISKAEQSFNAPLVVELGYGYKETLSKTIDIINTDIERP